MTDPFLLNGRIIGLCHDPELLIRVIHSVSHSVRSSI